MNYKRLTKSGKYNCSRGTFIPLHPDKYIGDSNPKFKSRLEQSMMSFCDKNSLVIDWSYEKIIIPYKDKTRHNTKHNYYMDFKVTMNTKLGPKVFLVEIKSDKETREPTNSARKKPETYHKEMETWIRNKCKWQAAAKSATARGWGFKIITEKQLK